MITLDRLDEIVEKAQARIFADEDSKKAILGILNAHRRILVAYLHAALAAADEMESALDDLDGYLDTCPEDGAAP